MASFEITRVVREINGLESLPSDSRALAVNRHLMEEDIPLIEAELALQRERLHELLLDDDGREAGQ